MATTIEEEEEEEEEEELTMEMLMREIDDNIVFEILLRLPANSLLRFQWACKYWFDLIKDPYFVKKHLFIHHPITTTHDHHQIIIPNDPASVLISGSPSFKVDSQKLASLLAETNQFSQCYIDYYTSTRISSCPIKIALPSEFGVDFRILGSCHGLLFFSYLYSSSISIGPKRILTLYITKEYKKLPSPPPGNEQYINEWGHTDTLFREDYNYGFGYDHKTDDYKVVRNTYFYDHYFGHNCVGTHVQVYTLGTNSWRSSEHVISSTLLPHSGVFVNGVFVNGALYWIDYLKTKIISFDIEKEIYQELSNQPEYFHGNLKGVQLEIFEGSLCLLSNTIKDPIKKNNFTEMWVMKDDNWQVKNNNNESSWTKLFRIPQSLGCFNKLKPLMRYPTSGEILLLNKEGSLFSCDPKNNTTKILNRKLFERKDIHFNVKVVFTDLM